MNTKFSEPRQRQGRLIGKTKVITNWNMADKKLLSMNSNQEGEETHRKHQENISFIYKILKMSK